jgi:hypothetical protein
MDTSINDYAASGSGDGAAPTGTHAPPATWSAAHCLTVALLGAVVIAAVFVGLGAPAWLAAAIAAAALAPLPSAARRWNGRLASRPEK